MPDPSPSLPIQKREPFGADSDGLHRSTLTGEAIYIAGRTAEGLLILTAERDHYSLSFTLTPDECRALANVLSIAALGGE